MVEFFITFFEIWRKRLNFFKIEEIALGDQGYFKT